MLMPPPIEKQKKNPEFGLLLSGIVLLSSPTQAMGEVGGYGELGKNYLLVCVCVCAG